MENTIAFIAEILMWFAYANYAIYAVLYVLIAVVGGKVGEFVIYVNANTEPDVEVVNVLVSVVVIGITYSNFILTGDVYPFLVCISTFMSGVLMHFFIAIRYNEMKAKHEAEKETEFKLNHF